jgi:hypothetical protein
MGQVETAGCRAYKPKKTDGQIFKETQSHMYRVLSDYYHTLLNWERDLQDIFVDMITDKIRRVKVDIIVCVNATFVVQWKCMEVCDETDMECVAVWGF